MQRNGSSGYARLQARLDDFSLEFGTVPAATRAPVLVTHVHCVHVSM